MCLLVLLALPRTPLAGQNPPPITFHINEVLAETTVLVINRHDQPHAALTTWDFRLSIDTGHPIHPKHVRVEGDEPIDLSILIDVSQPMNTLDPLIADAAASALPMYLPPASRVSIYFLDCHLTRTLDDAKPEATSLRSAVARGLAAWSVQQAIPPLPDGRAGRSCAEPTGLFDSLAFLAESDSRRPGHRVVLAFSTGIDRRSLLTWNQVRRIAASYSVAIFGLPEQAMGQRNSAGLSLSRNQGWRSNARSAGDLLELPIYPIDRNVKAEDPFSQLCSLTGGIRFSSLHSHLPASVLLPYFVTLVRDRYVIDFHPSSDLTQGLHQIDVKVAHRSDLVLATGLAIELSALQNADAPPIAKETVSGGRRKILSPDEQSSPAAPKR